MSSMTHDATLVPISAFFRPGGFGMCRVKQSIYRSPLRHRSCPVLRVLHEVVLTVVPSVLVLVLCRAAPCLNFLFELARLMISGCLPPLFNLPLRSAFSRSG